MRASAADAVQTVRSEPVRLTARTRRSLGALNSESTLLLEKDHALFQGSGVLGYLRQRALGQGRDGVTEQDERLRSIAAILEIAADLKQFLGGLVVNDGVEGGDVVRQLQNVVAGRDEPLLFAEGSSGGTRAVGATALLIGPPRPSGVEQSLQPVGAIAEPLS